MRRGEHAGCGSAILGAILLVAVGSPAFAAKKSPLEKQLVRLDGLLASNDLAGAQSLASAIYQNETAVPTIASPAPGVIIDPVMLTESGAHLQAKAAAQIAERFYKHAEIDIAKQWAQTAAATGALGNQYVRQAQVLLGDIAMAMDQDDEAVSNYVAVITLKNQYREQPAAYAGLLELLMLQKQDDLVEQWVRHGQNKFEGAGGLEVDFLTVAARTLKRRNHPLWRELNEQVVGLAADGRKLMALKELASNARKFGRYAEAETNYAAISAMPLKSAEETVNAHLFLAECQAQQGKDITPTLQALQTKAAAFTNSVDREYATYRVGKFYESQGRSDMAEPNYQLLTSSSSTSTWAAASLHQLAALKEKQGDLQAALQLHRQYAQRFSQNDRLAMQSLASALNVAQALGDTNATEQIASVITAKAATVQEYNVHLNLAYHYRFKKKQPDLAGQFLERGIALAAQALNASADQSRRNEIHFRVLRRLVEFGQLERVLNYFTAYSSDLPASPSVSNDTGNLCLLYKVQALYGRGQRVEATGLLQSLLTQAGANPKLEAVVGQLLGLLQLDASGVEAATPLLEAMAEQYPKHPWTNLGRLELAVSKFNGGDVAGGERLAESIIATSSGSDRNVVVRETYWGAVYLRGRCLQNRGDLQGGQALVQDASSQISVTRISQRLR